MTFRYQGRDEATVKDRANRSSGDYDDWHKGSAVKPKDGENNYRILPRTWDAKDGPGAKGVQWGDSWAIEVYIHRDIGPDKQTYICLDKMKGEPCPLCDARADIDDAEIVKLLKPKVQLLAYVIDRADEKAGPQLWRCPGGVEKEIQLRSIEKKTGAVILVDHPDEGYDISFRRKGTGLNTEYLGIDIERDTTYLHDKEAKQKDWLDYIQDHPLPEQLIYFDADHLEKAFMAKGSKKDKDEPSRSRRPARDADSETEARGSRDAARATRRPAEEPEEEDRRGRSRSRDPEPEAEEEQPKRRSARAEPEEEEEKPRRRPSREEPEEDAPRRRASREEPEDEPKGRVRAKRAEPEEEDEIPSKRSTRAAPKDEPEEEEEVKPGKASTRARDALKKLKPREDD
jgi:hypothetical protein